MPAMTIRNIPVETHRAIKARAAQHGRSAEAEVRAILHDAAFPDDRPALGSLLRDIGEEAGGFELQVVRDRTDPGPLELS